MDKLIYHQLKKQLGHHEHPCFNSLVEILSGPTGLSTGGYPYMGGKAYGQFLNGVPHLFLKGRKIIEWIALLERELPSVRLIAKQLDSVKRSLAVLRNMVFSAGVTAPPDLWLIRQVISCLQDLGVFEVLSDHGFHSVQDISRKLKLDPHLLSVDLKFLYSRSYLIKNSEQYGIQMNNAIKNLLNLKPLETVELETNWVKLIADHIKGNSQLTKAIATYCQLSPSGPESDEGHWVAKSSDVELGYKILPIVLACRVLNLSSELKKGENVYKLIPEKPYAELLYKAGYIDESGLVTIYGERVFTRGPGPFGIIHTYRTYMLAHKKALRGLMGEHWVVRGENVAASQDANRKSFKLANDALDRFCYDYGFSYNVFIEHAVGQGEALKQRLQLSGDKNIQYFGADLEDAAIEAAKKFQADGLVSSNTKFISKADIGHPEILVSKIVSAGFDSEGAVMMVGNGFHEVRGQTNGKMIDIFKKYQESGLLLIFTEESGLSDQDLLDTAWNTYHAGFRYVHDISGQGLRPAVDREEDEIYSWSKCAKLGGYLVMQEYTSKTRSIFPYPRADGYNPSISVTYFCVPKVLARRYGVAEPE